MGKIALVAMLLTVANGLGQTPPKDPDAVQALLVEVRQMRQDIETMTVASQRVQIALSGLQRQDAAVARAEQRLDEARNKRVGTETARARAAAEVQRLESAVAAGMSGDEAKAAQPRVAEMKAGIGQVSDRRADMAGGGSGRVHIASHRTVEVG